MRGSKEMLHDLILNWWRSNQSCKGVKVRALKPTLLRLSGKILAFGLDLEDPKKNIVLRSLRRRCREMDKPRVLELGTKRSIPDRSTRRDMWITNASEYLGCDIESGVDVDIVADVHRLTEVVGEEQFDVVISCSTFEHFIYPHLAAHQIMKVLKIGGVLFIQTHHTFPLHAYPYDYFRFSREALSGLFGTEMGFRVIETVYEFPARIFSSEVPTSFRTPAYLNVCLYGEKVSTTPQEYICESDV
jgi:SAM-dependent methyltransferase